MNDIILKLKNLSDLDKRILYEAKKQFSENGFYKTNVDDIADKLSIGKGTVYRHFGNKIELFLSVTINDLEITKQKVSEIKLVSGFMKSLDIMFDLIIDMFVDKNSNNPISLESIMAIHKEEGFVKLLPVFLPYIFSYREFMINSILSILRIGVEEKIIDDKELEQKSELIFVLVLNYFKFKFFAFSLGEQFTNNIAREPDRERIKKMVKNFILNGLKER